MSKDEKKIEEKNTDDKTTELSEVEILKEQCEEYKAGWARAQADYQNLQKETVDKRLIHCLT